MDLAGYLKSKGIKAADFAATLRISPEAVRLYLAGKRTPRADIMHAIEVATGGAVEPNDFYPSPTPPKRKRPANGEEAVR